MLGSGKRFWVCCERAEQAMMGLLLFGSLFLNVFTLIIFEAYYENAPKLAFIGRLAIGYFALALAFFAGTT
jgi:hypothetical protein